MYEYA
jgi:methylenetetrahydrofolate reductase (NADPH)